VPDGPDLGREVEEAVQHAADHDLPDVHAGQGHGGGERLAGRAQVVVLGVQHQGGTQPVQDGAGRERVSVGGTERPAEVVLAERIRLPLRHAEQRRELGQHGGERRRRRRDPGVQCRVDERERGRDPAVPVAELERRARHQVPAGAGAADRDPGWIDPEFAGPVAYPGDGGDGVVVRYRVAHAPDG
jgi:hypothetical protein